MTRKARAIAYGACMALATVGVLCGVIIKTVTGEALLIGLTGLGLGGILLLVFYEIGLSEDREVERAERERTMRQRPPNSGRRTNSGGLPG